MADDNAVEEIKSRLDIVELVSEYVALKRSGQNYKGLCPFHPEKTSSFMVSSPKQIFHCFGCGAGGDVFGFVMKYENLTFPETLELLAKKAGVELTPRKPAERGLKETIKAVNLEAQAYFVRCLSQSRQAQEYLAKREIDKNTLSAFGLGYAPDSWHSLSDHLKRKGFKEDAIQKAGLTALGKKGPYDIFRGRVMFPIHDMHGDIIAFGGRVMDKGEPKYLNSPDTPVFHKRNTLYALYQAKEALRKEEIAVITEGYMDAIACHQHGINNALAPLGTALTPEHVKLIGRYAGSTVLVFDGDAAGIAAARRSIELMLAEGASVKVLLLPEGQDPDSVLRQHGAEHLKEMLSQALSPVDFMLRTSKTAKNETLREALRVIGGVQDPILRDDLLGELADRTGTREMTLREELARSGKNVKSVSRETSAAGRKSAARAAYNEEMLLLSAAISAPKKIDYILKGISPDDIKNPMIRNIFKKIDESDADSVQEVDTATEEQKALISRLSLEPGFDLDEVDRVISDCILTIERQAIDEKIKAAKVAGDHELQYRLTLERKRLLQEAR